MNKIPEADGRAAPVNWTALALVLVALVICLLPVIFGLAAPDAPRGRLLIYLMLYAPALGAVFACYFLDRKLPAKEKRDTLLLCIVLTLLTNYLHLWLVDSASASWGPNLSAQIQMHEAAIMLRPEALPHSYRFLPDGVIRLFEQVTGDFASARDSYRNLFGVLVFYALYRFARLFLRHGGALLCLVVWAAILPVSFRYYAGQPADPMSHLSFLLAFIFLETRQFAWLLMTLLVGALAKETVLAMSGYYLLFRRGEKHFAPRAVSLVLGAGGVFLAVRMLVLRSAPAYAQVSGVSLDHIWTNWNNHGQWLRTLLFTVGIFIPFVVLGGRSAPRSLRTLALFLFPVLFLSGLVFSWLREARNFMPLCAPLIIMAVHYLLPQERSEGTSIADERQPA